MAGFTESNINLNLDEIKDSNRGDWIPGDDLHKIYNGIKELTGVGYIDLAVKDHSIYGENLELNNVIIYDGGHLDASGYDIIIRGDLLGRNASISCNSLTVWGNIDYTRKVGDVSHSNSFNVNTLDCSGNVLMQYTTWSHSWSKIGGNLTLTDMLNDDWFYSNYVDVSGDFQTNIASITADSTFQWSIGGNAEFTLLTSLTNSFTHNTHSFSVIGSLLFGEPSVSWSFLATSGGNAQGTVPNNYSGAGGGYIGGLAKIASGGAGENGNPGTLNGGGGGSTSNTNPPNIAHTGGAGINRGGKGGNTGITTSGWSGGGGGGGGGCEVNLYYGTGDPTTSLSIDTSAGNGGNGGGLGTSSGDGGDGGDGGIVTASYDTVPMGTFTPYVNAGTGGIGFSGGASGVSGSVGSSSHTPGGSPLPYHLPITPTFVTAEDAETSSIEFNVPTDANGSDLDFAVVLEEKFTDLVWLTIYNHDSNNNPSLFGGSAPYSEGIGTVTYTPPTLTSGRTYRLSVIAMKDTSTGRTSIPSSWLIFTYP